MLANTMSDIQTNQFNRLRPLRATAELRRQNAETLLDPSEFVYPMFLVNGANIRAPVPSMPGISQLSVDQAVKEAENAVSAGIDKFLLFGIPDYKDATGSRSAHPEEAVHRFVAAIRDSLPDATVITDVCLCEYTDHGHCGPLTAGGDVDNDATLPLLANTAVSHAQVGAHIVAPSAMMDGQVSAIRSALDQAGHNDVKILGYSAKYASSFYGPFRDAAQSTPKFGDRQTYQMATSQREEAMQEITSDIEEGADFIMVKPALAYLDIIHEAKTRFPQYPLYAYNVSGEFAMVSAAGANGWINYQSAVLEVLLSIKRAGADFIITYSAVQASKWLR